jgi:hypothetical protein
MIDPQVQLQIPKEVVAVRCLMSLSQNPKVMLLSVADALLLVQNLE